MHFLRCTIGNNKRRSACLSFDRFSRRGCADPGADRAGVYLNESDFVRDAIRHRLSEIKVIKCRDVDYETAKKEILGYFKSRGESYPDEASVDLELDFDLVMKITEELRKEGRLVEA